MKNGRSILSGAVALWGLCACSTPPQVSNTGFSGTWARDGLGQAFRSQVSIVKDGERYRFRWKLDSTDDQWHVRCNWDGKCEETIMGKKVADYTFDVRTEDRDLRVECTRIPVRKEEQGTHYTDLLVVDPTGQNITAYTIELNGEKYAKESTTSKTLKKVADAVSDPPGTSS